MKNSLGIFYIKPQELNVKQQKEGFQDFHFNKKNAEITVYQINKSRPIVNGNGSFPDGHTQVL